MKSLPTWQRVAMAIIILLLAANLVVIQMGVYE